MKNLKRNVTEALISYMDYTSKLKKLGSRRPNLPEYISENIILIFIEEFEKIKCIRNTYSKGDLTKYDPQPKLCEVKAFVSEGPISFGPTEKWDCIYFLDMRLIFKGIVSIYIVDHPETFFYRIQMNARQSFRDQIDEKRRPRITFEKLKKQVGVELLYAGEIYYLLA